MPPDAITKVEKLLDEFRNEFNRTAASFYTWKVLNQRPLQDRIIHEALNRNADAWVLIRHSLQVNFIVALGRLFDANKKSLTVRSFLNVCKKEIAQFNKSAFEMRRIRGNHGQRPDYLDEYMRGVYEATVADFDELLKEIDTQSAIYRSRYEPIRHKIIAHKDFDTFLLQADLFSTTNLVEIDNMLEVLFRIERVVTDLLLNGTKRSFTFYTFDKKRHIADDMESVLRQLAA